MRAKLHKGFFYNNLSGNFDYSKICSEEHKNKKLQKNEELPSQTISQINSKLSANQSLMESLKAVYQASKSMNFFRFEA